jgi:site-specific recombinase XerD
MAHLLPFRRRDEIVGWVAVLGVGDDGKRRKRFFKDKTRAESYLNEHLRLSVDPLHGRRHEVMFSLERLDHVGVSLNEVVEYYLRHGSRKRNPPLRESITLFLDQKRMVGRGSMYLQRMKVVLQQLSDYVGETTRVGDIDSDTVRRFVYVHHEGLGAVSKVNVLTHLTVFFNFCVQHDLIGFNPVKKVERPSVKFRPPSVLTPENFQVLLKKCLSNDWMDRMVVFVLVGFCGIRVEETSKLEWTHLDLDRGTVLVPAEVSKKHGFRMNRIPPNAMRWLELVPERQRKGKLIGTNWRSLLRSSVRFSKIDYRQNCVRHSFCSYSLSSGISLSEVMSSMGHLGSPSMVFSHYRNVVSEEDGEKWFGIVPEVS